MNVGFVTVNYNNAHHTGHFLRSIEAAMRGENFRIVVIDNASSVADQERLASLCGSNPRVRVLASGDNIGYFPALNVGLAHLRKEMPEPDAVLIGNNDLTISPAFRNQLENHLDLLLTHAVVSPDLVQENGEHQNPHLRGAVSDFRRYIWNAYYSWYWLGQAILLAANLTRRVTGRKDHNSHKQRGPVAQGYGACYLIGPNFFRHYRGLWAPTFLMQEEYFLYRQLQEIGQQMFYEPGIVVTHHGHASTGTMPSRKIWEIARESHLVYLAFQSAARSVVEFDHLRATPSPRAFGEATISPNVTKTEAS